MPDPEPIPPDRDSLAPGNTPLVLIDGIFVKLECSNPGGSIKDRVAWYILREAAARGEISPGDLVVEATSGNTGIALALVARHLGYRALIFMPEHMSVERKRIIENLGADVSLTPREEGFEGAITRRNAYRGRPGCFVPDQFDNPENTACHRETTGAELIAQLREKECSSLDAFAAGVGTGGTLMGVGQALREAMPKVRIVAVEPAESSVMGGGPPGEHGILGIGDGFIPGLMDMKAVDEVISVTTMEAHEEADRLRRVHGFCVGRSAGANMIAAARLRDRNLTVATLLPDCSNRYLSLGLESPSSAEVRCDHRHDCRERTLQLLGEGEA